MCCSTFWDTFFGSSPNPGEGGPDLALDLITNPAAQPGNSVVRGHVALLPLSASQHRNSSDGPPVALTSRKSAKNLFCGSLARTVGKPRLGLLAKCMIEREFCGAEGSKAVGFSHADLAQPVTVEDMNR